MKAWIRIFLQSLTFSAMGGIAVFALLTGAYFYVEPTLPDAVELRDYQPQIPMSIYSRDLRLMQQYGEQKRTPVPYEEILTLSNRLFWPLKTIDSSTTRVSITRAYFAAQSFW